MNRKEEYAIAAIILVALVMALASIVSADMNLGIGSIVVAIIAVLYSIFVIHVEGKEQDQRQQAQFGEQNARPAQHEVHYKRESPRQPARHSYEEDYNYGRDEAKPVQHQTFEQSGTLDESGSAEESEDLGEPVQTKKAPEKPAYDFEEEQAQEEQQEKPAHKKAQHKPAKKPKTEEE